MRLAAGGAGAAQVEADLARVRAAAEGGVWAAAHRLAAQQPASARAPRQEFAFALGGAEVAVRSVDEDGRLDLNAAPEPLLAALFAAAGLASREAAGLAMRVAAWRESPAAAAGPGGRAANNRFRSAGELAAALPAEGPGPGFAESLRGAVTVHTGRAQPAAEAAPPLVLAALRPPEGAAGVGGPAGGAAAARAGSGRRQVWHIEAEARSGAVVARVAAVISLAPGEGMPGRVLEWRPVGP